MISKDSFEKIFPPPGKLFCRFHVKAHNQGKTFILCSLNRNQM